MKNMFWRKTSILLLSLVALLAQAATQFMSIKSNKVNARVGPGTNYPVSFVFLKAGEPVEVIAAFKSWRQIKDIDGDTAWVHVSLLSSKRSVIVKESLINAFLFKFPGKRHSASVEPKVRCSFLNYCYRDWCHVRCQGHKGWIERDFLWGIHDNEFIDTSSVKMYLKILGNLW